MTRYTQHTADAARVLEIGLITYFSAVGTNPHFGMGPTRASSSTIGQVHTAVASAG